MSLSRFPALAASLLSRAYSTKSGVVFDVLARAEGPLTTAQLWEAAKDSSIKSKRHMKSLISGLKNAGKVKTTPNVSGKGSYGYSLAGRKPRKS